jgi:tetratricopeptide (TPR) repeat protein
MPAIRVLLCWAILSACGFAQDIPFPFERFSNPPRPDEAAQAQEDTLKHIVAVHPESADAWTDFGWRLYKNGHYGECEYAMGEARKVAPADPYVLWLSGLASYAMGHYADAHTYLWQMWKDNRTYPETVDIGMTYDLLGRIALHDRDLFTAAYFFSKAAEEQHDNWQVEFLLGITEWYRQQYGASFDAFERARALRPKDALVLDYYAWARAAADERDYARAQALATALDKPAPAGRDFAPTLAAIDAALKADPENALTYELEGRVLQSKGDTDGAIKALRRAVALDPKAAGPPYMLAKTLLATGSIDARIEAKELLIRSVALAPGYWEGDEIAPNGHLLAQMFADEGSYERAQDLLDWLDRQQDQEASK